jgi:hypothetical protein
MFKKFEGAMNIHEFYCPKKKKKKKKKLVKKKN